MLTLIDPPYGTDEFGAWAATGAFLVVYFAYGRRFIDGATHRGTTSSSRSLFAVVLAVGTAFEPAFAILQAFVYPFVWIDRAEPQERPRREHRASRWPSWSATRSGSARPGLLTGIGIAVLSVGFSIALGLWITRIAELGDGARPAARRAAGRAGPARGAAPRRRASPTSASASPARSTTPSRRASPGLVMLAQRAGNRLDGGRRRRRGIRARRHRADRADGARGAHRGARARRVAHAGRGRRRPRRGAATARDRVRARDGRARSR